MPPTDKNIWDKEVPVPPSTISYVNDGIRKKLPPGTVIAGIAPSGASYWARTAKIEATNLDGEDADYFVKVHQGEHGKTMVSAEFEAMSALFKIMPEIIARPVGWGSYESFPDTYFFVCEYHEMSEDIPDLSDFPALIAEMHKRGISPDGKFGFPLETFSGNAAQNFPVTDTWEECFSRGIQKIFAAETKTHGRDEELESLTTAMVEKVIPRLLRPLETEGRKITPTLVHGDMWEGNCSVDVATGSPMIFDAAPLYAHNEYELGAWRPPRHKITRAYIDEYIKHYQVSEPAEEFDDRGEMYCVRFDMHASSLFSGNTRFRKIGQETMSRLVKKYDEGYEGYAKRKGLAAS